MATKEKQSVSMSNKVWRKALLEIKEQNAEGLLLASEVVDHARHPDHILHGYFDWSDEVAAEKWRLMQARTLIRAVIVPTESGKKMPAFVSLMDDRLRDGGGYRSTEDVITSKELLAELEVTAKKELRSWTERFNMLESLVNDVAKVAKIPAPKTRRKAK